ncbi:STAS domain-containing protein [Actinacidiphila acidipaludis]|uniref:STAS domain-containing protein n=1 Tax=Actinacidiphila acidipaludis TaxID=2873382 RepID=A0ABS7QAD0_9ACTN|nr:STAS domain-containing protein [Streptomyces acidipaludis]MBY8880106.1 STAS domain-containing protein [Streptomyces acidipaludis]
MDEQRDGGLRIVRAESELDWERAQAFGEQIREAVSPDGARVVVDLSGVDFADSATLHILLDAHRDLAARGGLLVLAGPLSAGVRRLFDVTMTAAHFEFAADTAAARRALATGSSGADRDRTPKPPESLT